MTTEKVTEKDKTEEKELEVVAVQPSFFLSDKH